MSLADHVRGQRRTTRTRTTSSNRTGMSEFKSNLKSGAKCHWSDMGWAGEFNKGVDMVQRAAGMGEAPAHLSAQRMGNALTADAMLQDQADRAVRHYKEVVGSAAKKDLKVVQAMNSSRIKRNDSGFAQFESMLQYADSVLANKGKEGAAMYQFNQNEIEVNTTVTGLSYGYV